MRTSAARRRSLWRTGPTALRKTRHAGLEVRKGSGIRRVSVFVRLQYAAWDNEPLDGGMREQWGFWREFVLCRYVDELLRCQLASREGRPTRAIEQQWAHALHSREFLIRFISAQPDYNSPRSPVIFNSWYRQGMVLGQVTGQVRKTWQAHHVVSLTRTSLRGPYEIRMGHPEETRL